MYNTIRKLHLYAGLVVFIFLTMYFVSGYVLIHRNWFGGPTQTPVQIQQLPYPGERTPEALSAHVTGPLGLTGRVTIPKNQPKDALRLTVFHPGTAHHVELPHNADHLTLRTTRENLAGTLIHLHRIHGYGRELLFNVYVFLNDLASFSCILFAFTGVYLWWKTAKRKLPGLLCLTASCAYSATVVLYLLYAR